MGALSAGVGLGKTVAVGETDGEGGMTRGVDVADGVSALVGGKLTSGVDVAGRIGVPVAGKLAIGAGLHAAKHRLRATPTNPSRRLLTGLHSYSIFAIRHSTFIKTGWPEQHL
jgi:hypothetical protein